MTNRIGHTSQISNRCFPDVTLMLICETCNKIAYSSTCNQCFLYCSFSWLFKGFFKTTHVHIWFMSYLCLNQGKHSSSTKQINYSDLTNILFNDFQGNSDEKNKSAEEIDDSPDDGIDRGSY